MAEGEAENPEILIFLVIEFVKFATFVKFTLIRYERRNLILP
jgi:hypothetical protein